MPGVCSFFAEGNCARTHDLVAGIGGIIIFSFVYVAVKHGEPNEEGNTDEIFHAFYVGVIIYQRENFLDFAY